MKIGLPTVALTFRSGGENETRTHAVRCEDRLRGWQVNAVVIESNWQEIEAGDWRSKLTPGQVQSSLASWIAQGHTIIMGENPATAAKITRGILFYAARYRFREAAALMTSIQGMDAIGQKETPTSGN